MGGSAVPGKLGTVEAKQRRISPRQRRWIALMSLLSVVVGGLVAYALWSAQDAGAGGVIRSGSLDVSWTNNTFSWTQLNDYEATTEIQSGSTTSSLAAFKFTPGCIIELRQGFTVVGEGDNLSMSMDLATGPSWAMRPGWSATWTVEDALGNQVAPDSGTASVGSELTAGPVPAGTLNFVLVLQITFDPLTSPDLASSGHTNVNASHPLGGIVLTVDQVRGESSG